jgi:hypothetical protein
MSLKNARKPIPNKMRHVIFPYSLFVCCSILYGCGHQCACDQTVIGLSFVGYPDDETDSIKIIQFKPDDQFTTPLDSVVISSESDQSRDLDTLNLVTAFGSKGMVITSGNDWEIINLYDGSMTKLSEIAVSSKTMHCGGIQLVLDDAHCNSPITSFVANGVTLYPPNTPGVVRYYINK